MPAAKKITVTRYVGKCPVCEAEQKLTTDAMPSVSVFGNHEKMVHHAFSRPGDGEIHGGCYAVGAEPYEISCETTRKYRDDVVAPQLASRKDFLRRLESGDVTEILEISWSSRETITHKVGDPLWTMHLRQKISSVKWDITKLEREVDRLDKLINDWTLQPLRTVEEFEAPKREERLAAKNDRAAKRAATIAKKIASYQKRIDSAVRRHTSSVIADIFESCQRARHDMNMSHDEIFAAIDRNSVFAAFGLDVTKRYDAAPNEALLRPMRFDWDKTFVWPVTL